MEFTLGKEYMITIHAGYFSWITIIMKRVLKHSAATAYTSIL
jgi:hypothetical protein